MARVAAQAPDWRLLIVATVGARRAGSWAGRRVGAAGEPAAGHRRRGGLYRQASLYLMTSRYEGLPMVLIEAMSFGLPLVAYDCKTGPAELMERWRQRLSGAR